MLACSHAQAICQVDFCQATNALCSLRLAQIRGHVAGHEAGTSPSVFTTLDACYRNSTEAGTHGGNGSRHENRRKR